MITRLCLIWNSYLSENMYFIGTLDKLGKNYLFIYKDEAIQAEREGCMLPFPYTEKELYFSSLPDFFSSRVIGQSMRKEYGIPREADEIQVLAAINGRKNSDSFYTVSEDVFQTLKAKTVKSK